MDDYTREMMDLKTLVTRTLEKKGVLAKIRVRLLHFLYPFRFHSLKLPLCILCVCVSDYGTMCLKVLMNRVFIIVHACVQ